MKRDEKSPELTSYRLKNDLVEGKDYVLVDESIWNEIEKQYGGGPPIPRKVITEKSSGVCRVEVYPLKLNLFWMESKEEKKITVELSRSTTIQSLKGIAKRKFSLNIDSVEIIKLWDYWERQKRAGGEFPSEGTLEEVGMEDNQNVLVEVLSGKPSPSERVPKTKQISNYYIQRDVPKGLTGLVNLGNTCFMNAAFQCLAHCSELLQYFKNDEIFQRDLNVTNPIGYHGEIATAFRELLKDLWSGDYEAIGPRHLKLQLAKVAPQFGGFQQHDCQEFLSFLLDALHEDLNRLKTKHYSEVKEEEDSSKPDIILAQEAWKRHLARNDSVIVDLFQGQFKSKLVCPDCRHISLTFDPYSLLSLPLIADQDRIFKIQIINVLQFDFQQPITLYAVKLEKSNTKLVSDLLNELAKLLHVTPYEIILVQVQENRISKFLDPKIR